MNQSANNTANTNNTATMNTTITAPKSQYKLHELLMRNYNKYIIQEDLVKTLRKQKYFQSKADKRSEANAYIRRQLKRIKSLKKRTKSNNNI